MIPDHYFIIKNLFDTGKHNLKTHAGQAAFTDEAVRLLNALDSNWRHLKKSAAQTNIHLHGEDSALYLLPDGRAWAVDFIGGAGGPDPRPGWMPDPSAIYTHADGMDPKTHHGEEPEAPVAPPAKPALQPLSQDEAMSALRELNAFYGAAEGLQRPGGMVIDGRADLDAMGQWFYQLVVLRVPLDNVKQQIRGSDEWKAKH